MPVITLILFLNSLLEIIQSLLSISDWYLNERKGRADYILVGSELANDLINSEIENELKDE